MYSRNAFAFLFMVVNLLINPKIDAQSPGVFSPYASLNLIKYSNNTYSHNTDNKVGYEYISQYSYKFNRHGLQFYIGTIPSYATIDSARLSFMAGYNYGDNDGTIRFTKLTWDWPELLDDEDEYNLISSGTLITGVSITTETTYSASLANLVSEIQSAISSANKYISIGAYNQYEGVHYGTSFSNVQLTIYYSVPTPPKPTNLHTTNITAGSIGLEWNASSGATGYKVYKNGVYYNSTSSTAMTICDLYRYTSYSFYVIPYNSYGDGPQSDALNNVWTLDSYISGSALLCSSEDYYAINVPSGANIVWDTPSSNIYLYSDDDVNPATFNYSSNGNGIITLDVTSACVNYSLDFNVHSGAYSSSDYEISGPTEAYCESYVYFSIPSLEAATSINWDWPQGWTYISGYGTEYLALMTGDAYSSGYVSVGVDNDCGQSGSYDTHYVSVYGWCGYFLSLTPNPASNEVMLTINEPDKSSSNNSAMALDNVVSTVIISDNMGKVYNTFQRKSKSFTFTVQNLKNGNYLVTVMLGNIKLTAPLVVLH